MLFCLKSSVNNTYVNMNLARKIKFKYCSLICIAIQFICAETRKRERENRWMYSAKCYFWKNQNVEIIIRVMDSPRTRFRGVIDVNERCSHHTHEQNGTFNIDYRFIVINMNGPSASDSKNDATKYRKYGNSIGHFIVNCIRNVTISLSLLFLIVSLSGLNPKQIYRNH